MHTILETDHFAELSAKLLSYNEKNRLIDALARNPKAGNIIRGTGGFRKYRLAREGGGKSGGYRVVYFYYHEDVPLYLVDLYAKNRKENLTKEQMNELAKLAMAIKRVHRRE